jgi:hypothetical protein
MYISAFYLYSNRDFDGWDGVTRHILTVPATVVKITIRVIQIWKKQGAFKTSNYDDFFY